MTPTRGASRVAPPAARPDADVAAAFVIALDAAPPDPALAFTGDNHEDITRAALPWEPVTLSAMADARDGAVNANDHGGCFLLSPLHCDNADYLAPRYVQDYPRSRDEVTTELLACIRTSVVRNAVRTADGLVDADGKIRADQSDPTTSTTPCPGPPPRSPASGTTSRPSCSRPIRTTGAASR
ncbi:MULTISPECIES: hypothetical protein [unclassified Streptomyces]|uniref:hypothetical protein n=1 Tax=unclassified Streptomyces TaxID=2593676 RepID=UPI002E262701|nr:hypothetical protein OG296_38305 [Streptomyces sp. NBC_01001]